MAAKKRRDRMTDGPATVPEAEIWREVLRGGAPVREPRRAAMRRAFARRKPVGAIVEAPAGDDTRKLQEEIGRRFQAAAISARLISLHEPRNLETLAVAIERLAGTVSHLWPLAEGLRDAARLARRGYGR